MITKTIRLLLLVPFLLSAVFWEGARMLRVVWLRVPRIFPGTFSGVELRDILFWWRMPTLDLALYRFEDIFEDNFENEFWVNYPTILNKRTWCLHVLLWACVAEVLRLILCLWNRTYTLWPRKHSPDILSLLKLTVNMPSLRYLDYDVRSLRKPELRKARKAKLYAEDYVRNQDVYFFNKGVPAIGRIWVDLLWRELWKNYHLGGGRGKIAVLEQRVLNQFDPI